MVSDTTRGVHRHHKAERMKRCIREGCAKFAQKGRDLHRTRGNGGEENDADVSGWTNRSRQKWSSNRSARREAEAMQPRGMQKEEFALPMSRR